MEAVAQLEKHLARLKEVRAAEGETVVQQHAAVGDVCGLKIDGKALAEVLAERKIESGVTWQVIGAARDGAAGRKAGSIIDVGRGIAAPGQTELAADMKRVALIVVQETETWRRRGAGFNESAGDTTETQSQLIRVSEVELRAAPDPRGAKRQLPPVDARTLHRQRKKQVGVVEIVMVEKVFRPCEEVIGVKCPAAERNGYAELMCFVTLAIKRNETQILRAGRLQERTGSSE